MIRRLFWIGVGVGITVYVAKKGKQIIHQATPAGIQERLQDVTRSVGVRVEEFVDTFKTAYAQREAELSEELLS